MDREQSITFEDASTCNTGVFHILVRSMWTDCCTCFLVVGHLHWGLDMRSRDKEQFVGYRSKCISKINKSDGKAI